MNPAEEVDGVFFFPYKIDRPFRLPLVTIALIVTNVLVFALSWPFTPQIWGQLGFRADVNGLYTWFTSMFLHGDALGHLAGNMYFLWLFGSVVEDAIGRVRYVLLYLAGGLAAALINSIITAVWLPEAHGIPLIGASGAIAAIMGVFAVRLYKSKVRVFFILLVVPGVFRMSSLFMIALWIAREAWTGTFAIVSGGSSVANWAHVGGAVFGALAALLFGLASDADVEYLTDEAGALASDGSSREAAGKYAQLVAADPQNPHWHLERARASLAAAGGNGSAGYGVNGNGGSAGAAGDIAKGVELLARSGRGAEVLLAYEQLAPLLGDTLLPAKTLLTVGSSCEAGRRFDLAAKAYWDVVQRHPQTHDVEKALFRLPHVYLAAGMPAQAAQVWLSFLAAYPASEWIPYADRALTIAS